MNPARYVPGAFGYVGAFGGLLLVVSNVERITRLMDGYVDRTARAPQKHRARPTRLLSLTPPIVCVQNEAFALKTKAAARVAEMK